MTPEEYRSHPKTLNRMTKPELLLHYTLIDEGVPLITDGIVLEINRRQVKEPIRFIGMEKTMPVQFTAGLGTESGIDPLDFLWRGFHKQKENTSGLFLEEEIGVSYPCPDPGYFNYFAGARAGTEAAAGYREWKLPEGEYIVCSFEAENFEALVMEPALCTQVTVINEKETSGRGSGLNAFLYGPAVSVGRSVNSNIGNQIKFRSGYNPLRPLSESVPPSYGR